MTHDLAVDAAGRTHVGLVRRRNEDALYVGRWLFAVADGLGGHVAGDIASKTIIESLPFHDRPVAPVDLPAALGLAIRETNQALRRKIEAGPELAGMGSTLVAMLWSGTAAVLANVGDSRAYVSAGTSGGRGGATRITEDHTYEHLVAGAASVPNLSGRLSRWLDGRADGRSPDLVVRKLNPGDRFLMCSDGVTSYVPHDLVDTTLRRPGDPDETAGHLVTLAIDHGGRDNVAVIVIDVRAT